MLPAFEITDLVVEQGDEGVEALQRALDSRDLGTHLHSLRAVCYAVRLGRMLQLRDAELRTLQAGVLLHDIGKVHVPDAILRKPGPLTAQEWKVMRGHPTFGHGMVSRIASLREAAAIVLAHHEWFDGNGYPHGLVGEEIPLAARILSVADALDAMTASDRPYRQPVSFEEAAEELRRMTGRQFDPLVVEAFGAIPLDEWATLRRSLTQTLHYGQ